ncbi:MAG: DNA-binding protein WhiA [Actinobacteria bacterium]|nr:MAG: DNA-binding protein WhiA [Actinomycetota bacterium]
MSFTSEIKTQLAKNSQSKKCCQKALLSALLKVDGSLHIENKKLSLESHTENSSVARMLKKILTEYGLSANVSIRRSVLQGHTNYAVVVASQPKLELLLSDLGLLVSGSKYNYGIPEKFINSKCCAKSYLTGIFLGAGYLSHPKQSYHLGFDLANAELATDIVGVLSSYQIKAHVSQKKNNIVLSLQTFDDVCDFLALIGASGPLFYYQDIKIIKEIKNKVNRLINFETANVEKVIKSARRQINNIAVIDENYGLEKLSPALKEIVCLRVDNPEASLEELAGLANPKLSKSAVNHRLRRISELAKIYKT